MVNKSIVLGTIFIIVASIISVTIWKNNDRHEKRVLEVVEKRIIEGAEACYQKEECQTEKVTLQTLIELGYAEKEINPKTKNYYSLDSYVEHKGNEYRFYAK